MESHQVNVLGWYNHGNIGDEAFKEAFLTLYPQYNFNFLEAAKKDMDLCVLGGGDVVGGYFMDIMKKAKRKIALGVTINNTDNKDHVKEFEQIFVRDYNSLTNCRSFGVSATYIPDLTFSLQPNKSDGIKYIVNAFNKYKLDLYGKKVGVIINSNLGPGHDSIARDYAKFEHFCYDLANVIDNYNASFVFIPFGNRMPYDDRISNGCVASKCKYWKKNLVIFDELSVQTTLDVIASCDIIISTRLHSSIFSCISAVPFIDIVHNHKNRNFLDTINYKLSIEYKDFSKTNLLHNLHMGNNYFECVRNNLLGISAQQRKLLYEIKDNVHLL